jgi:hypothetical protein
MNMQSAPAPFVCLVSVLVFFVVFLQTTHAALCPYTFSNFTTCAIRNGLSAAGDAASMKQLINHEYKIMQDYDADKDIFKKGEKAAECLRWYKEFRCIQQSHL